MSAALLGLAGVMLAAALAQLLLPNEGRESSGALLHFLTVLAVLALLLRPFAEMVLRGGVSAEGLGALAGSSDMPDFEQQLQDAVQARSVEQCRAGIQRILESEYGICADQCTVEMIWQESEKPERIWVFLSGAGLLHDPREIEAALERVLGCEVEVR